MSMACGPIVVSRHHSVGYGHSNSTLRENIRKCLEAYGGKFITSSTITTGEVSQLIMGTLSKCESNHL